MKHFQSPVYFAARALAPDCNVGQWSAVDRDRLNDLVPTLFKSMLLKMGHAEADIADLRSDLGRWALRSGQLSVPAPVPSPLAYWQGVALTVPLLAKVAIAIFSIVPSEACVERSFSHQSLVHSDLRNRMSDPTIHAVMSVRMNVGNLFEVPHVQKKAKVERE